MSSQNNTPTGSGYSGRNNRALARNRGLFSEKTMEEQWATSFKEKQQRLLENEAEWNRRLERSKAKELAYLIDGLCPTSREQSTAMTHLETAVMWANAAIARNE